jgi:hypothetical protein
MALAAIAVELGWLLILIALGFLARVVTGPTLSPLGQFATKVAATLESVFALCLGCQIFAVLMRIGLVPRATCERCANIWAQPA